MPIWVDEPPRRRYSLPFWRHGRALRCHSGYPRGYRERRFMGKKHPTSTDNSAPGQIGVEDAESGQLRGFQRKHLRGLAHGLDPVVHVGREGASEGVLAAIDDALITHELIKVRMHRPADKKALASQLAQSTGAQLCGIVGHMVILYRENPEEPKIRLPAR